MAETSASLPLRQFVLTVPFEFRARLAYDKKLTHTSATRELMRFWC